MRFIRWQLPATGLPEFFGSSACASIGCHAALFTALALTAGRGAGHRGEPGQQILATCEPSAASEPLTDFAAFAAVTDAEGGGTGPAAGFSIGPLAEAGPPPLSGVGAFENLLAGSGAQSLELGLGGIIQSEADLSRELIPAGASFYGIEAEGNDFVFVVDMSGSMEGGPFRRARGELKRSLEKLAASQRFFVIFFHTEKLPLPAAGLVNASADNVRQTIRWAKQIEPGGGTSPASALDQALDLTPDGIFLLTDGEFDLAAVEQVLQRQRVFDHPVPVHTICFLSRKGERSLKAVAEQTGGTHRFIK